MLKEEIKYPGSRVKVNNKVRTARCGNDHYWIEYLRDKVASNGTLGRRTRRLKAGQSEGSFVLKERPKIVVKVQPRAGKNKLFYQTSVDERRSTTSANGSS